MIGKCNHLENKRNLVENIFSLNFIIYDPSLILLNGIALKTIYTHVKTSLGMFSEYLVEHNTIFNRRYKYLK